MSSCCVIGCKSRGTNPAGVIFFQLPLNKPAVLTQWLIVLDRRDWIPKPTSRICSLHFSTDDYISQSDQGTARLKPDAIPSVFPDLGSDEDMDEQSSPTKKNDSGKEESPNAKPKSKSKPPPVYSTPVPETQSQRPRRAPKVSSKMKDYILLDEIKRHKVSSPVSTVNKGERESDTAAKELLSILEDSNSLSGDDIDGSSSKSKQVNKFIKAGGIIIKKEKDAPETSSPISFHSKPAPASVKRAKQIALLQKSAIKVSKVPSGGKVLSPKEVSPKNESPKSMPLAYRKTYFQVKDGDKVLFLSYADLNPIADMTKDNALYIENPPIVKTEVLDEESDEGSGSPSVNEFPQKPGPLSQKVNAILNDYKKKSTVLSKTIDKKTLKKVSFKEMTKNISNSNANLQNVAVIDNSGLITPAPAKRYKTVAELVVRTDYTGEVPNVSIDSIKKMPNVESDPTPRKKRKISSHPIPPIQSMKNTFQLKENDKILQLSKRITETINKMKHMGQVKGSTSKLTVLITSIPPVKEDETIVITKQNHTTKVQESKNLRVAITDPKNPFDPKNANEIPIMGACEIVPNPTTLPLSNSVEQPIETGNAPRKENSGNTSADNDANEEADPALQHDHTYISPSLKVGESEGVTDENSKEMFSKLKLSDEEINFRSKVHRKLRLLKETVKRKNEHIYKLRQKLMFLEKSLREERKTKKRIGMLNKRKAIVEEILDGDKSPNLKDLPILEYEENDESDDEERGDRSPITYICEPAIDVCERPTGPE